MGKPAKNLEIYQKLQNRFYKANPRFLTRILTVIGSVVVISPLLFSHIVRADGFAACAGGDSLPCRVPFFVVQGGDVATGSHVTQTANNVPPASATGGCHQQDYATVAGYNNDNNPGAAGSGWYGAAVQGAIYSPELAQEVVTDENADAPLAQSFGNVGDYTYTAPGSSTAPSGFATGRPSELGFANHDQTDPKAPEGLFTYQYPVDDATYYGGNFGLLPCIPNQYSTTTPGEIPYTSNTIDLSTQPAGDYYYTGSGVLTIADSGAVTSDHDITLNVPGSVYIATDIDYNYSSPSNIPQIVVNVDGTANNSNIYIQNDVQDIHGVFTAQSSDGSETGFVETCAYKSGTAILQSADLDDASSGGADCDHQLNIYGSMEADWFFLERSWGDLDTMNAPGGTNASNASEVFSYSPEVWIPDATKSCPSGAAIGDCLSNTYSAETSLPPVL